MAELVRPSMLRLSSPRFPSPLRSRSSLPSPFLSSQAHRLTGLWAAMPAFTPINLGRATTTSLSLAQNPSCRTRTSLRDTIFTFHDLRRFRKRILRGRGVEVACSRLSEGTHGGPRRFRIPVKKLSSSQCVWECYFSSVRLSVSFSFSNEACTAHT